MQYTQQLSILYVHISMYLKLTFKLVPKYVNKMHDIAHYGRGTLTSCRLCAFNYIFVSGSQLLLLS